MPDNNYNNLRMYFLVFFGMDSDEYGNNYQEIVDSSIIIDGISNKLIEEIDEFIKRHPDNESAIPAFQALNYPEVGDVSAFPPSLIEFLRWLSVYLKRKRTSATP